MIIESFNEDFISNRDPIFHMEKISEEYPIKVKHERLLKEGLENIKKNFGIYKNIKKRMEIIRSETIQEVI